MPKKVHPFRLSDEHYAILEKYAQDNKLDNTTEALESILQNLPPKALEPNATHSGASDPLPTCYKRIEFQGHHLCVNRPPKAVQLVTVEICNVCKAFKIGLGNNTKIPTEETFDRGRKPITDPNNPEMKKAGMAWCPEGLWVFVSKCGICRVKAFGKWDSCQREKYRQKGEQARHPT